MNTTRYREFMPNFLTLLNLSFGFSSIILSIEGQYGKAAFLILGAVIVDSTDGFIARRLRVGSQMGMELDSLADFLSFCIAPAILFYHLYRIEYWVLLLLLPICGALRLARFNANTTQKEYFTGLPTTTAGGFLASITLIKPFNSNHALILTILLSLLMVSNLKYKNFKNLGTGKHAKTFLIGLATVSLSLIDVKWIFTPFLTYMILGIKTKN